MKFPSWLRNPVGRRTKSRKPSLPRSERRWSRLMLEPLEERLLLATVTWTNPAGGDWDTTGNWSTGALPGPADDVVIGTLNSGASVTHARNTTAAVNSITAHSPITLSQGTLQVKGALSDSSDVSLTGGTLQKATIAAGTALLANYTSTLDDVTLSGLLHIVSSFLGAGTVQVTDTADTGAGLTLNGGSILMDPYTSLTFAGTQTLAGSGTVTAAYSSGIDLSGSNQTLTIAAGITIKSSGASLDAGGNSLVNQGTLSGDASVGPGGGFTINGTNWINGGIIEAIQGGAVNLSGSWTNRGTIHLSNGTVNLGGTLTRATLGTVSRDVANPGTLNLTGTLNLAAQTLEAALGPLTLAGGTINGGTVSDTLLADRGTNTLDDVTLSGLLHIVSSFLGAGTVQVIDSANTGAGLTLNGGSILMDPYTSLTFAGTQRLAGSGTVTAAYSSGIDLSGSNQTLTIAAGITIKSSGASLDVGSNSLVNQGTLSGDAGVGPGGGFTVNGTNWVNDGTIQAINGGTVTLTGSWTNLGTIEVDGGTLNANGIGSNSGTMRASAGTLSVAAESFVSTGTLGARDTGRLTLVKSAAINQSGILVGQPETTITVQGNLVGTTRNADQYATQGMVTLAGSGTAAAPQLLETMSNDVGNVAAGFQKNFAYGAVALANNTYVQLVDKAHNSAGTGPEAVYAGSLLVPAGTTLDLNGLHLYARAAQITGTVMNGSVSLVPGGGPVQFAALTPGTITTAGAVDDWTFFGRAGHAVQVFVGTGSGSLFAPLSPSLNFAQVELVSPSGSVVATATNATGGADVILRAVTLPADGTYHIRIQAAPGHATNTGSYLLTLWDAPLHTASLNLNENTYGQLVSPYAVDQWTFTAADNQQIRFNLLATAMQGFLFDLTGPGGYTAFSGATSSSSAINLPASGTYTLTVHATHPTVGTYAFDMLYTSLTPLTSGVPYHGVFAGSGQAQLFTIATPQDRELLIALEGNNQGDHVEVYAKFGAPPTRADYQYQSAILNSLSQTITVPKAAPGTWYILVYAEGVAGLPDNYTLTTTVAAHELTAVFPNRSGTAADADTVLTLAGAGFDRTSRVSLVAAGGTVYNANQTQLDLPTQLSATFTLGSVPPGVYSVVVTRSDGASDMLPNAFTMVQGGHFDFKANLVVPGTLGNHSSSTLYLQYSNTGDLPMPAPILNVTFFQNYHGTTVQKALLTLDAALAGQGFDTYTVIPGFSNTVQVLAGGAIPGVIGPGESITVPIYWGGWVLPRDFNNPDFHPEVGIVDFADTTPVPWSDLKAEFRPPQISAAAWDAVFPNLVAQIGNTWGDFVQRLDKDAIYLAHLGEKVADIDQLWAFEIQQANGFSPVQTLSTALDASVLTPGPALAVDRALPNSLNARNQAGPFGMGWQWASGWQRFLTVAADGTISITDPDGDADGALTVFTPDGGGGYAAEPGDDSTLTAVSGGFLLQKEGSRTRFGSDGSINYVEDTHGNKVTASYTNGLLTRLNATTGQSLTLAYNGAGRIAGVTDSTGHVTTYTYDASNQHLLSVTDFAGRTTSYTYDTSGVLATQHALLSIHNPDGTVEHFTYDARGRLAQRYVDNGTAGSPTIAQVGYVYGPEGEVAATDAVGGTARYFADARGLFVKVEDPLGCVAHVMYDRNYNRTQVIDPAGHIISFAYDSHGNPIKITGANGDVITATFSGPYNNLESFTDPNGNTTRYGYNGQGDLLSITYPNGSRRQFSYDPIGNLTESINGRRQATHTAYNSMGQLTQATFADGTFQAYAYDAHGNLISAGDGTDTTTFRYDPITQYLVQVNYPGGRSLAFSYDSAGRRAQSVDQDGFTVTYAYKLGLLAGLTDGSGNPIVAYTYDAAGRLSRKDLGNGTFTTYLYDLNGNIVSLVNHAPGGAVNSRFDYTYDIPGNVASMTTLDGVWTYQYDPNGRLTDALFSSSNTSVVPDQHLQYVYDLAGNRTETIINGVTTTYVTNSMNQYTQIGSANLTYDADGNLIAQTDGPGTTTYTYNELNRLIRVSSPTGVSGYQYDPLGNLASVIQNGQTTRYVVDPIGLGNIVGEYASSGSLVAHYTYGLGLTSRVAAHGQAAYYDFDRVGSTVGLSGTAGTYQNLYRYQPFGESLTSSGAIPNTFQFVGQFGVMAQANGLTLMRARFYSSTQGRFLSLDPLGLAGGQSNLYAYAGQNPLTLSDPTGQCRTESDKEINDRIKEIQGFIADEVRLVSQGKLDYKSTADLIGHQLYAINYYRELLKEPKCKKKPPNNPKPPSASCPVLKELLDPGFIDVPCSPDPKSSDPNAKTGPAGYGPEAFIPGDAVLPYRIEFENEPKATAPAQLVVVTDPLDADIDRSTLQFTEVGFGDNITTIPSGSQHFQTTRTMTYNGLTFNVLIELAFNTTTGVVTATFQSIDPTTELPPPVLIGFLPPEDGTGRGLGYFSYTAMLKAGLPTGTEIRNVATVIFDDNQPITTDQVDPHDAGKGLDQAKQALNTIDAVAPTSSVAALPAVSPASFTVTWSGQDDPGGSGIDSFNIYVSDNGADFALWQDNVTETSAVYAGVEGHTYRFYSIATDHVGNAESGPANPDAITTVKTTTISIGIDAGPDQSAAEGGLVSVQAASITYSGDTRDVSLTIDWGDATEVPGAITWQAGAGKVTSTHRYRDDGAYTATLRVAGTGAPEAHDSLVFQIANVVPTLILGGDATVSVGQTISRTGSFTDPGSDTWTAAVDYGTGAGFVPLSLNTDKTFVLSTQYNTPGTYSVVVRVTDDDGGAGTARFKMVVGAPPDKAPPRVKSFLATKKGNALATMVVGFSEAMARKGIVSLRSYRLISAGKDRRFGTKDDKVLALGTVVYDQAKRKAKLTPKGRVALNQPLELIVRGSGAITDLALNALDGNGDHKPGGDFIGRFGTKPRK
jgi:RHS repeat-associated protein